MKVKIQSDPLRIFEPQIGVGQLVWDVRLGQVEVSEGKMLLVSLVELEKCSKNSPSTPSKLSWFQFYVQPSQSFVTYNLD